MTNIVIQSVIVLFMDGMIVKISDPFCLEPPQGLLKSLDLTLKTTGMHCKTKQKVIQGGNNEPIKQDK